MKAFNGLLVILLTFAPFIGTAKMLEEQYLKGPIGSISSEGLSGNYLKEIFCGVRDSDPELGPYTPSQAGFCPFDDSNKNLRGDSLPESLRPES